MGQELFRAIRGIRNPSESIFHSYCTHAGVRSPNNNIRTPSSGSNIQQGPFFVMGAAACKDVPQCKVLKLGASAPSTHHVQEAPPKESDPRGCLAGCTRNIADASSPCSIEKEPATLREDSQTLMEYTFELQPGTPLVYGGDATDLSHRSNLSDVERQRLFEDWRHKVRRKQADLASNGGVSLHYPGVA